MTGLLAVSTTPDSSEAVWTLETTWRIAPWATLLGCVGIVLLVAYCYAKELSPAGRPYRVLLGLLRLTTVALLMVMLSEALLSGTRSGRPRFVVMIDRSGSMGIVDPASEAAAAGDASASRLDSAVDRLSAQDAGVLARLAEDYDLELIAIDEQAEQLEPSPTGWAATLTGLQANEASPATRLGDAIHQRLNSPGAPAPQGVLVVSDGQVTAGRPLSSASESARRSATPLYFLGVGSPEAPPDVALGDLLAEEVVFVDDIVSFRATLRTTGPIKKAVRVTLRRDGQPDVLAEQLVEPTGPATPVQLLHRPEAPGVYRYTLSAEAVDAERNIANNELRHELTVRDQKVGVLLVAGGPSYEFRYLKHLLERDSTVELSSFLQEADAEYATADPSAVNQLPLDEESFEPFDAVVLIDLDPKLVPRSFWLGLRRFVGDSGGGLAIVAGPRWLPGAYQGLPDFAALYPGDLSSAGVGEAVTDKGFRVTPTPLGWKSAAMQLADDPTQTQLVWSGLPELYWYAELGELKPAAQVLASHPTATAAGGGPAPLVVAQFFGAGRVVLHAVDATYRWRRRTGEAYFARYWVQTLRSLARGRLTTGEGGIDLTVNRQRYEPGESVRLRLRTTAPLGEGASVLLKSEEGPQKRIALTPSAEESGMFEATLDRLPIGSYRILLSEETAGVGEPVAAAFEVVAPPGEFARLQMAKDEMRDAAERSRGAFFELSQAEEFLQSLPEARRVPLETLPPIELWNRWWMLAAICTCLCCEWILRKRRAML